MAEETANREQAFAQYWLDQLDGYHQEFQKWEKRCERIVKRYRDERQEMSDGRPDYAVKFNALWSNVQTLSPAVYKKAPQPVVDRRYLDKDPVARFASMTLERALEVTIEDCYFHPSTQRAVLDYLLCGRGQVWNRYEPTYGTPTDLGPTENSNEGQETPKAERATAEGDGDNPEPAEGPRPVTWEKVYQDYIHYKKFRHSPVATWEEVWWVAKGDGLTRREVKTRFPNAEINGKHIADLLEYKEESFKDWSDGGKEKTKKGRKVALIWEIWDKNNKEVVFIADGFALAPLERVPDPLNLIGFFPCPKPVYATVTNDCLVPVPDYVEYQDQAEELDNLAARIKALTDAIRVNGVYDASIPELKRILQEGADNRLVAVQKWGEFSSKGGLEGAMDFIPLKDIVEALIKLQETFDVTKRRMDEITGISDIVRGQSSGAAKTATEQRIKGQFATLRLEDRQAEIARFCRDILSIAAEIISEQFSPEILAEMTGMLAFITEELESDAPPLQPGQGPDGQPMPPDPQMEQQRQQQIKQGAQKVFGEVINLLRNDKTRTFRIDIETDSTVAIDRQAEKEAVVEMFTALGGFLEKAVMVGAQEPAFVPALGQSLMFAFRRFGVGRDVEGAWEQAIDKVSQKVKKAEGQPPPPSPEQIKAEAEVKKQQMESQRQQEQAQIDREKAAMDMQAEQQKQAMELQKMQAELAMMREELAMKREEMQLDAAMQQQSAALDMQTKQRESEINAEAMERDAEISERAAQREEEMAIAADERAAQSDERKVKLAEKTAEIKAKQAAKPKAKA
jgi:hypothetical protein